MVHQPVAVVVVMLLVAAASKMAPSGALDIKVV
jgi:hypothetical protein